MTLPKGPWGTKRYQPAEQIMLLGEVAGEGGRIIGWVTPAPGVDAEELARQLRALPALVEAAREIVGLEVRAGTFEKIAAALRIVDGEKDELSP